MDDPEVNALLSDVCAVSKPINKSDDDVIVITSSEEIIYCETPKRKRFLNENSLRLMQHRSLLNDFDSIVSEKINEKQNNILCSDLVKCTELSLNTSNNELSSKILNPFAKTQQQLSSSNHLTLTDNANALCSNVNRKR